jgi:mevalonate kinase
MTSHFKDPFSVQGKSETPTKERLFVGAYIPRQIAEYISVYALLKGIPKSHVIDIAIRDYSQTLQEPMEDMIDSLSERAIIEWKNYLQTEKDKKGFPHLTFEMYLNQIQKTLHKRGISLTILRKIIEKVKNATY